MNYPVEIQNKTLIGNQGFIGGSWVGSNSTKTTDVSNPATGEVIGTLPFMSHEEATQAVKNAAEVFPRWAGHTALQRANMLMLWYERILTNIEDLAAILTAENGKPLTEAHTELRYAANFVRWYAEECRRTYGRQVPQQNNQTRVLVIRQPVGVTAAITPWNFPAAMITRKLAPALAVGCPMVIKPSELTPYTAIALVKLAEEVGFSAANGLGGVIQLIFGDAPAIGKVFCESPVVKKISLTGSTRVGKILMRQSAEGMKKLSLELGGNAPFIVFDDADLDAAVQGAAMCKYRNSGQTCICANRIYVQEGIYDAFVKKLTAQVSAFKVADGFTEGAQIGPLINRASMEKAASHVTDAVSKGAKVMTGGKAHALGQTFYEPTVLRDVSADALLNHEETFGPIGGISKFATEAEVLRAANHTEYGLAAYFFSKDISRSWRVAEQLEAGIVGINEGIVSYENAPFGGHKQSGMGSEGGQEGINEYLQSKYILMGGLKP